MEPVSSFTEEKYIFSCLEKCAGIHGDVLCTQCMLLHMNELPLWLVGWNSDVWDGPSHFVLFPLIEPGLCVDTISFSHSTLRMNHKEKFAELEANYSGFLYLERELVKNIK